MIIEAAFAAAELAKDADSGLPARKKRAGAKNAYSAADSDGKSPEGTRPADQQRENAENHPGSRHWSVLQCPSSSTNPARSSFDSNSSTCRRSSAL
jgi:hypothetical protein